MLTVNTPDENNSVRSDDFNEKSRPVRQANVDTNNFQTMTSHLFRDGEKISIRDSFILV